MTSSTNAKDDPLAESGAYLMVVEGICWGAAW